MTETLNGEHNAAEDSVLTSWVPRIMGIVGEPIADNFIGPIAERNHLAGVATLNLSLTAPRLLELPMSSAFLERARQGETLMPGAILAGKLGLKLVDGVDGDVARRTGTTSVFGAIGDPLVDMAETASDNWLIYKLARDRGHKFTAALAMARSAIDTAVIGVSAGDYLLDAKLKKAGIEVPKTDEAKANAYGKLKFGLSTFGNPLTQGSYLAQEGSKASKALRTAGNMLNAASCLAGAVSIIKYRRRHAQKKKLME